MEDTPIPPGSELDRAHRRRRLGMIVFWVVVFASAAIGNTMTSSIDAHRYAIDVATWQIAVNEVSSVFVSLLILPLLLRACDRWPLHADTWRRRLLPYLAGSVAWSACHVIGMDLLRWLGFSLGGAHYDPGSLALQAVYEYLKDIRTFFLIVAVSHFVNGSVVT